MKHFYFILMLCFFAQPLLSQNYYVAIVKGKVYYQNKLLQKRDKITINRSLRFTTDTDYIKVSGPGGLHTIRPWAGNKTANNEFIVAITNELFAPAMLAATIASGMVFDPKHYFSFSGHSYSFFKKTYFPIDLTEFEHSGQLAFLHQTDKGLVHQIAPYEDGQLLISAKEFNSISKDNPIHATTIVIVRDMPKWLALIKDKNDVSEIIDSVEVYGALHMAETLEENIDSLGDRTETIIPPSPLPPAMILDDLGPIKFISERLFIKDIRFHIKKCAPLTREAFLEDFLFEGYILEIYGYIYTPSLNKMLEEKLGLLSSWELNVDFIEAPVIPDN